MPATLSQLNISPGGMPKRPIASARVTLDGVENDRQKNRKYHGGRDRAICLFSEELYAEFQAEGIDIHPGDVGENFTTRGLDLSTLSPGNRLQVGGCLIEIVDVRVPCKQLKQWHEELPKRIEGRSGWMARVVKEGNAKPGDPITVIVESAE